MDVSDAEIVDPVAGLLLRRIVVGPFRTNCWVFGPLDGDAAVVVDPGAEAGRILDATTDRRVEAIVLTHTHGDHVGALDEVAEATGAPVRAHPAEAEVSPRPWRAGLGQASPLVEGDRVRVGSVEAAVWHTPGHTPGGVALRLPGHVLVGDTLFPGGPGATRWPYSDFPTVIDSIQRVLFALPDDTAVHPGHGHDTTIGTERPALPAWIERGW